MAAAQPLNIIVMKRNKNCMRSLQTAAQRVCACVPYRQAGLASPRKDTEQPASMAAVQRLAACVCVCVAYKQACQVSSHKDGQSVTTPRQQTRRTEQPTVPPLSSVQLQNEHCICDTLCYDNIFKGAWQTISDHTARQSRKDQSPHSTSVFLFGQSF